MHQILQIEYLSSDWMIISANGELPPYWKNVWYAHRITNNGTNKYLQIKEQSGDGIICLQIEVLSVNWRLICRSKIWRLIWRLIYLIWRLVFNLQIEELHADGTIICRSSNHFQTEVLPADQRIIYRLKNNLQVEVWSADWKAICRPKNYLHIILLSTDASSI